MGLIQRLASRIRTENLQSIRHRFEFLQRLLDLRIRDVTFEIQEEQIPDFR